MFDSWKKMGVISASNVLFFLTDPFSQMSCLLTAFMLLYPWCFMRTGGIDPDEKSSENKPLNKQQFATGSV